MLADKKSRLTLYLIMISLLIVALSACQLEEGERNRVEIDESIPSKSDTSYTLEEKDAGGDLLDTDPQVTGVPALPAKAVSPDSEKTAKVLNEFVRQAAQILADEAQANMLTMRGIAKHKPYPSLEERFKMKSLCLANYPMYRGVSFLVGMDMYPVVASFGDQVKALKENWDQYDFFFIHAKTTDKTGEDGNFAAKVAAIEELDQYIPQITALNPDVLVITGDHSTPSAMKSHSWHPVPVLLSSDLARLDWAERLTELDCLKGALGQIPAKDLMGLALAHAGRLAKFGA
ncbi:MAG: hypothetical protein JSU96_06855 [Acidobacteriota bacterium]|nr:MAG: hypothetical protein JSU96_06855 [Acidobacteriota bacterium]